MNRKKDGSVPLKNKRRENFCQAYAMRFWGHPADALKAAGYHTKKEDTVSSVVQVLLASAEVRGRIAFLRDLRADASIVDDAWIRELLAEIAAHAERDSDRIRALANLAKVVAGGKTPRASRKKEEDPDQSLLPFFECEMEHFRLPEPEKTEPVHGAPSVPEKTEQ